MRVRTTAAALGAIALLSANLVAPPVALAVAPPVIEPGALPPNDPPGPTEEMKQNKACVTPVVIACVTTCSRLVSIAFGMVLTAVEFLAETWQPPRLQKP